MININFLNELKEDYNAISLKYRGINSPKIVFENFVTDHNYLRKFKGNKDIHDAAGIYLDKDNEGNVLNLIIISTNLERQMNDYDAGPTISHEMGHYIYCLKEIEKSSVWESIYNEIKNDVIENGDKQASKDKVELFADAFAEYYTGKIRGLRKSNNLLISYLEREHNPNLSKEEIEKMIFKGMLDDYPRILPFLIEVLGKRDSINF